MLEIVIDNVSFGFLTNFEDIPFFLFTNLVNFCNNFHLQNIQEVNIAHSFSHFFKVRLNESESETRSILSIEYYHINYKDIQVRFSVRQTHSNPNLKPKHGSLNHCII